MDWSMHPQERQESLLMEESEFSSGIWLQFPLWRTPTARLCILTDSRNIRGVEMIADDEILETLLVKARSAGQWTVTVKVAAKGAVEVPIDEFLTAIRIRRSARQDDSNAR
jgi:hypothetical protein